MPKRKIILKNPRQLTKDLITELNKVAGKEFFSTSLTINKIKGTKDLIHKTSNNCNMSRNKLSRRYVSSIKKRV